MSPAGAPARVFDRLDAEAFELLVSEPILAEYARGLSYPHLTSRLRLDAVAIARVISGLRQFAILVEPKESFTVIPDDPTDDKFLECAHAGEAEHVVSGDKHLLRLGEYRGIQILSPAGSVALLATQSPSE